MIESIVYIALIALLLVAHWQIGNKNLYGWLVSIVARGGIVIWSLLTGATALVPITLAFLVIDWRNFMNWRQARTISQRIADRLGGELPALDHEA